MSGQFSDEPMIDVYIFETTQNIEQLEQIILASEKESNFGEAAINEIFRLMHTIKGSSAMMLFNNIATVAHAVEDLFFFLRESKPAQVDCAMLSDLVLSGIDFTKVELAKVKNGDTPDGEATQLMQEIRDFLQ
ncbi:MAG: Hpt domain-containing protein, partial [Peptococcaceae bacterium]|nr:Hpt domain-containing protein [Peptococcaceae bacterium]